jgi:hypothetical protein
LFVLDVLTVILLAAIVVVLVMWRRESGRRAEAQTVRHLLQTFGPAQVAVQQDPRQLLVWYPLAEASRTLYPEAFAAIDAATGGRFPFSRDTIERAHAKVSTEWLGWERAHDEEYRLKGAAVEQEIARSSGEAAVLARARLDRVQHEKIERYQQRYEEYIRTAKALQALLQ